MSRWPRAEDSVKRSCRRGGRSCRRSLSCSSSVCLRHRGRQCVCGGLSVCLCSSCNLCVYGGSCLFTQLLRAVDARIVDEPTACKNEDYDDDQEDYNSC